MFVRVRINYLTHDPFRALLRVFNKQYNVIYLEIFFFLKPLLPLQQIWHKLINPTSPKLIR